MSQSPDPPELIATASGVVPSPPQMGAARNIDKLTMLAATGARLAVGMLTFIILARYLGPAQFGVIASAIAYTSFASTLSDFGFGVSGLRLASADVDRSARIIGDAVATKMTLFVLVTLIGGAIAVAVLPTAWLPIYALVHIGSTANGLCELLLIGTRARRLFTLEARLVISSSTMMLLVFGGITALTRDLTAAAAAYAFTRILYLSIIRFALRGWLETFASMGRPWADIRAVLRRSTGFAADSVLTLLAGQVDVLLFAAMMPVREFGVYQAGARLAQVFVSFAPVLSSVYLPALSAAAIKGDEEGFRSGSRRLSLEFAGLAVIGGLGFLIVGPFATPLLYGAKYASLATLWPGFAAFALLRFGASGFGIQLAALGHVRTRISSSLISIAFLSVLAVLLLPRYGLSAAPLLLAAGALPSITILGIMLARDPRSSRVTWVTLPAMVAIAAAIMLI
jgi:O-antigen/teichoic acid export membrane protein